MIAIGGVVIVMLLSFMSSVSMVYRAVLDTLRSSGSDSREASGGFAESRRSVEGPDGRYHEKDLS